MKNPECIVLKKQYLVVFKFGAEAVILCGPWEALCADGGGPVRLALAHLFEQLADHFVFGLEGGEVALDPHLLGRHELGNPLLLVEARQEQLLTLGRDDGEDLALVHLVLHGGHAAVAAQERRRLLAGSCQLLQLALCFGQCVFEAEVLLDQFVLEGLQLLQLLCRAVFGPLGRNS